MENTPTAPAPTGESENNNPNPSPAPEQTSAPAPAPAPDMHGFTSEQLADIDKFFKANGGFDSIKSKISNYQPQQPAQSVQPQPTSQPQQPIQPQQPAQPTKLPDGFVSQAELNVERYFKDLASKEKYGGIADKITSGDILREMASMGMNPIDENYNINAAQVKQFLDLKAAAVPTQPASAPITNTPLADYVQVGENITSKDEAYNVLRQSYALKAQGLPPHPAEAKAEEFLKNSRKAV